MIAATLAHCITQASSVNWPEAFIGSVGIVAFLVFLLFLLS